jgi:hypothetical protein
MSKHRVAVLKVVSGQLSVTAAAAECRISRGSKSAMTLRRAGRLHHLNTGAAHARRRVFAIVGEVEVTVVALDTGELVSVHRIEPDKGYWRNTRRDPGRWPGSQQTG